MVTVQPKACCITGLTNIPIDSEMVIISNANSMIDSLLTEDVNHFYVGGALGFDILVTEQLLIRKNKGQEIKIHSVIPYPGWSSNWPEEKKSLQNQILQESEDIVYVRQQYCRGIHLIRDKVLIDSSTYCITYCNRAIGGTAEALRYAINQKLHIFNTCSWELSQLTSKDRLSTVAL